jgi:hypothetical protein
MRQQRAFRPAVSDPLEERIALSHAGAAIAAQVHDMAAAGTHHVTDLRSKHGHQQGQKHGTVRHPGNTPTSPVIPPFSPYTTPTGSNTTGTGTNSGSMNGTNQGTGQTTVTGPPQGTGTGGGLYNYGGMGGGYNYGGMNSGGPMGGMSY